MDYVIDSNLIFSAALNFNSGIAQFILKSKNLGLSLFAPKYLETELERHLGKTLELTRLSEVEFRLVLNEIYSHITFINDELIPFEEYIKAMRIIRDIDPDDVTFLALNNYIESILWTGDEKLYQGLKKMGYERVINFHEIKEKYNF